MSLNRLRKQLSVSKTLVDRGVWFTVDLGDGGPPLRFLVARYGRTNRKWLALKTKFNREHGRRVDAGLMSPEEIEDAQRLIFCQSVLLDWENVNDVDEKPIPYTPEAGAKLLKEFDVLYDYLMDESVQAQNYQEVVNEDTVGNLQSITSGT